MGGSLGVESVQQKEEAAFAARVNTAKSAKIANCTCYHWWFNYHGLFYLIML